MMTWKQIKLATLQKMFAAEGEEIPTDESVKEYIYAMPYACNEALQLLATAGKFIIKSLSIAHFPVPNLINDSTALSIHTIYDTYEIKADKVRSCTMDIMGTGKMEIYVGDTLVADETINNPVGFVEYKSNIENTDDTVRIVFTTDTQMAVKSIGLYACSFPSTREIPPFKEYIRYVLKDYASDYYQLDNNQIYYEGDQGSQYIQTSDYFQEGNKVLVLPRKENGNYTIYYKAYAEQITSGTEDDYVLPIDEEVVPLIPLYMASQLYKDDDNAIATTYRNEFEVAFERLTQKTNTPVLEHFKSDSGWI